MMTKSYSELIRRSTFQDRFEYLKLQGIVAGETFGGSRYLNQQFYRSAEWKKVRDYVILRDNGCDLGIEDRPIFGKPFVHHMNPVTKDTLIHDEDSILDPEFLITVSFNTHNAIHYGDISLLPGEPIVRTPGDTKLW